MINDITKERQTKILEKALDWFSEHFESKELYEILKDKLTMTDDEIDFYGFELSDFGIIKGISLIHLHEQNDDCYFYTNTPIDLFRAAIIYQYNISNNIDYLTLDSFISEFGESNIISDVVFSVMSESISTSEKIANILDFDFENSRLSICGNKWDSFRLCDIGEAIDEATFNDQLSIEDKHSIFIQQLIGKEIEEEIESDEGESPSMNM